ncbi:hypothetical protein WMO79_10285 [Micrococcaceae bacterium Sec7.4]
MSFRIPYGGACPAAFDDDASTEFKFENTPIKVLNSSKTPELVVLAVAASLEAGARMQSTI